MLSVRSPESWWQSFSGTIRKLIESRDSVSDDHVRAVLEFAHEIIVRQTFGGDMSNETAMLAAFQRRIDEVTEYVPAERLLVFGFGVGLEGVGLPTLAATVWGLAVLTWVTVLQRFYRTWVQLGP